METEVNNEPTSGYHLRTYWCTHCFTRNKGARKTDHCSYCRKTGYLVIGKKKVMKAVAHEGGGVSISSYQGRYAYAVYGGGKVPAHGYHG
jgi:hypothetical protein